MPYSRANLQNANKWVQRISDVSYLIQIVDTPLKQDSSLTLVLLENVLLYVLDSLKLAGVNIVIFFSDNSRDYDSNLVSRAFPLLFI